MTAVVRRGVAWMALLLPLVATSPLGAQTAPPEDEAQRLYLEGRQLLEAGDLAGALAKLEPSLRMQPSPNTELLIAHALRRKGRTAEAMAAYLRVVDHAGERVAQREQRYTATLEDAGRWVARLRTELAEVQVVVAGAAEGTQVLVDETVLPSARRGSELSLALWHAPGLVSVRVSTPDGRSTVRNERVSAAQKAAIRIDLGGAAGPPDGVAFSTAGATTPATSDRSLAPPPITWVAGGVAVAGLGVFAAFGAMSLDNASEADRCAPRCPPSLTEEGDRHQTVANVGLAVAGGAAVVAVLAWIIDQAETPGPPPARGSSGRGVKIRF